MSNQRTQTAQTSIN